MGAITIERFGIAGRSKQPQPKSCDGGVRVYRAIGDRIDVYKMMGCNEPGRIWIGGQERNRPMREARPAGVIHMKQSRSTGWIDHCVTLSTLPTAFSASC